MTFTQGGVGECLILGAILISLQTLYFRALLGLMVIVV
jgi:hypothetical protein